ncbi:hypothetical protein CspeluHIS016_0701150 [Cutaneotrichosporon spelunceum]|uniref:J domain-containing protein n=1 Tax=Cutaneotrichosporon spelunceum TaxID=1672016 RepID=A0AAD3TY81_9TREE|nr:hypothetical protein CspeluHIS016_0701150 [Cutaneotrichosporon spelunceum]
MASTEPGPSAAFYRRFPGGVDGPLQPEDPSAAAPPLLDSSQSPRDFLDSDATDGLYAILNVPRDASNTDIQQRYRTLAAQYHPDKQPDEARRRAAHGRFQDIQRAHEVLTDPGRRTVYDMFGEEGLRTSWEVGPRNLSPAQMRRHYERQGEVKRKLDAESLVNSKGELNLTLDARGVFLPKSAFKDLQSKVGHSVVGRAGRLAVGQTMLKHSFENPISDKTQLVIETTMAAMNGRGGANVSGTVRHQFSPRLWGQVSQSVLFPRITSLKLNYTHDEMSFITVNAIQQNWAAPPRLTFTLGRQLWPTTTGFINYSTGFWTLGPWGADMPEELALQDTGSMSVGVTNAGVGGKGGWTVEAAAGLTTTAISADYTTFVAGLRLKLGAGLDVMDGLHGFMDGTARVTESTRIGAMLKVATNGVRFVLHFGRLGQRIRIPILLSFDANPRVVLWATVLPIAGWAAFYNLYMVPRKKKQIERRIKHLRSEHAEYIAQKRQDALDAILLMERAVSARAAAERERNGLVITDAYYGRASAFTPRGMRDETVDGEPVVADVTIPVQALVASSRLFIPAGPAKHNLLGFYDPCIGEKKRLRVRYLFQGRVHEVEVDDLSALRAPVREHAVE